MKQTLQRLDQILDAIFQKDQCHYLSSGPTEEQVEVIEILMEQYETQMKLMIREMKRFEQNFQFYCDHMKSKDEKSKVFVQKVSTVSDERLTIRYMGQCVAILHLNFQNTIKILMNFYTPHNYRQNETTRTRRIVESVSREKIEESFRILREQTISLTYYLGLDNNREPLPLGDTTHFSEILTKLKNIMRQLEAELLKVCSQRQRGYIPDNGSDHRDV